MNFGGTIRLNRVGLCIIVAGCLLCVLYMNLSTVDDVTGETGKNVNLISLRRLLLASIDVAEKGGREVIRVKNERNLGEKSKGKTKEGVNDPVTQADYSSHCVMFYNLKHLFPKLKVISEEKLSASDCGDIFPFNLEDQSVALSSPIADEMVHQDDVTVWIDPLDATKEFTENYLQYVTTMVCVSVKGKPIIGVIHKPFHTNSKTYWAWVGKALSPDLRHPVAVEDGTSIPRIIVSMSHSGEVKNVTEQAFGKDTEIIYAAGAGFKSLEVAHGNATAYIHTTAIKKWDICAGNAILEALGGKMTTLTNTQLDYSSSANVVNEQGLLATLFAHDWYVDKMKASTSHLQ